jgi:hypothetical protein
MGGRVWFLLLLLVVFPVVEPAFAATFFVNNTGDAGDAAPGDGFCATGARSAPFAPQSRKRRPRRRRQHPLQYCPGGAQTIVLGAALPSITSVVTIDGTTQPGFVVAPPFAPIIEVSAALCGAAALDLRGGSSGSTIRGLDINRCPAVAIRIAGSSNNVIAGNFLGTNLAGTGAGPGNDVGVYIGLSVVATNNNRVGGTAPADRNVISGNGTDGIQINAGSGGAANNLVQGNYIGVDVNGTAALANTNQGVALFTSFSNTNNVIGGTAVGARNVISGNGNDGILIANAGTTGTLVQGNYIGTNAVGTGAIPNLRGIEISASASGNTIGGPLGSQNVISGNTFHGLLINASNNNTVSRAHLGTDEAEAPDGTGSTESAQRRKRQSIVDLGAGNVISGTFSGVM